MGNMGSGGAEGGQQGGGFSIIIPLLLIMVVFYFLMIRPQQRAEKKRKEMLSSIKKGYRVITAGGIRGVVAKVYDKENIVLVTIAPNVDVEVALSKIEAAAPPGEALPAEGTTTASAEKERQEKIGKMGDTKRGSKK